MIAQPIARRVLPGSYASGLQLPASRRRLAVSSQRLIKLSWLWDVDSLTINSCVEGVSLSAVATAPVP